jgi:hypothetical protein
MPAETGSVEFLYPASQPADGRMVGSAQLPGNICPQINRSLVIMTGHQRVLKKNSRIIKAFKIISPGLPTYRFQPHL